MFGAKKVKALKKNGLFLENIPENERTARLCRIAVKQNSLAIKYVPNTHLDYKICLEAVKKKRHTIKYVPSRFVNSKMCKLIVKENDSMMFTGKYYDGKEKLFFVKFNVVNNQIPNRVLCKGIAEFSDFDDFYAFLNGDLSDADLKNYDFENVNLNDYNTNGAIIHQDVLKRHGLFDSSYFDLIASRIDTTETILKNEIAIPDDFKYIGPVDNGMYNSLDYEHIPFFYISDIHLEYRIFKHFKNKASKEEIHLYVKDLAKELVLSIGKTPNNSYLLIAGDTSSIFDLSKVFFRELAAYWNWKRIIVIPGNHELRDPYIDLEDNINAYRDFFKKAGIIFLQNDLYFAEYKSHYSHRFDGKENTSGIIHEEQLLDWSKEKIRECVRQSSVIIFGGLGFSGLNPEFNATTIPYGKSFRELPLSARLEKDIQETKRFRTLYNKVFDALSEHRVIILTHTDKSNWSSRPYNKNWIYLNGHTHHNFIDISEEKTVYADNQIGYKSTNIGLKYFYCDNDYDVFAHYEDGIHKISRTQFIEFHLGKNIPTQHRNDDGTFYVLKRNGIYMFFICKFNKKAKRNKLFLMNGGKLCNIERNLLTDLEYYYNNLEKYKTGVDQLLNKYTEKQKTIADFIKKLGGDAKIHGCVIDISEFYHIYVNPLDGKITPYYAQDISARIVFKNLKSLLQVLPPFKKRIFDNYLEYERNSKIELSVIRNNENIDNVDFLYDEGSYPYKISRIIRSLQYCYNKGVIRNWNENLLDDNFINQIKHANSLEEMASINLITD